VIFRSGLSRKQSRCEFGHDIYLIKGIISKFLEDFLKQYPKKSHLDFDVSKQGFKTTKAMFAK